MPIIGLTDKSPEFPRIGILRKGDKKNGNAPGRDLDYFRFVGDDAATNAAFDAAYGLRPQSVNVFLPFPTVAENWEAWKEEWKASALQHRCDGETCVLWLRPDGTYSTEPKKCPGGCKQVGRLKVVIPELARYAIVTVLTTGKWDVMTLDASLKALDLVKTSPTLQGIPLVIRRVEREISTPRDGGKRARVKKWLLQLEASPLWVALQLKATERAALPTAPQLALGAGNVIEADHMDDDDGDDGIGDPLAPGGGLQSVQDLPDPAESIVSSSGEESGLFDEAGLDAILLGHCKRQKGEKNGPAFFKAQYGEKAFEQKLAIARDLGLIGALPAEAEPDPLDEIEALIVALRALGKTVAEIDAQLARLGDGQALDEMDGAKLIVVRDGLAFWRDMAKEQLTKGAAK